jgi:hypothetical protein
MVKPPSATVLLMALLLVSTVAERQAIGQKTSGCPLTDTQTQKAIDAFAKIAAFVTTEPRCVNCHGGVNPYLKDTGLDPNDETAPLALFVHGGGVILRKHEKAADGTNLVDSECADCHDNMAPRRDGSKSLWMNAANFHSFVDKDAPTLCKQFKRSSRDANDFLGHMTDDNGGNNFAGTAFRGDRGLDRDRFGDKVKVQLPSLTHPEFMKLAHDWIDSMGGQFRGDASCGCEFQHAKWSGQIHYVYNLKGDDGKDELQTWSNSALIQITINVTDGVGIANSRGAQKNEAENRQSVFGGGYKKTDSSSMNGSASGSSPAQVDVRIDERTGTYTVSPSFATIVGTMQGTTCVRDDCKPQQMPFPVVVPGQTAIWGKVEDRYHVQGSRTDKRTEIGRLRNGVMITTISWDLSRSGGSN